MAHRAGRHSRARNRAGIFCLALSFIFGLAAVGAPSASAATVAIESAGPLTKIEISDTLNCSVRHAVDGTVGEFFGDTACGTFLAAGGKVYGPADIPGGSPLTGSAKFLPFTPVSQTKVTGRGTPAEPFRIVTVVAAGQFTVTETDLYVVGQETYRTDVAVANGTGSDAAVTVYRAGDCFLNKSDFGFGRVEALGPSVACRRPLPTPAILQWRGLTAGANYFEGIASTGLWPAIASGQPFPSTCRCDEYLENGAGLSWTASIPAGATSTFSELTTVSPAGRTPLSMTKFADSAVSPPNGPNGYTVTITNPNSVAVQVGPISDRLPNGFTYVLGSTTPVVGGPGEPAVGGVLLTWPGPVTVPPNSAFSFHFNVTASGTFGTYFNNIGALAAAASPGFSIGPSGDAAPITVAEGGTTTTSTTSTSTTSTTSTTLAGATTTSTTLVGDTTTTTSTTLAGGSTTSTAAAGGSSTSTTAAGSTATTSSSSGSGSGSGSASGSGTAGATATTARSGAAAGSTNPLATTGSDSRELTLFAAVALAIGGAMLLLGRDEPLPPPRELSEWEMRNGRLRPPRAGR